MSPPTPHSTAPGTPAAGQAEPKRTLQNTPINRAFLFLLRGVRKGSIKVPPITDMSDQEAEIWPTFSGEEYMTKALDAQLTHESNQAASHAALAARCRELEMSVNYYRSAVDGYHPDFVPASIRLANDVRGDGIFRSTVAPAGDYICSANQWGAVSINTPDAKELGIKPREFSVLTWKPNDKRPAAPTPKGATDGR